MSIIKSSVFKFILYTACLAAISSCTDEIGQEPVPDRDDYLHFSAGIEKTRAETGQDGSGSFSEGDCIGVYIDNGSDIYYRESCLSTTESGSRCLKGVISDMDS